MYRKLLPRLSTFLLLNGSSSGCDYVFAERSPDILFSAISQYNFTDALVLQQKYEEVREWSETHEELVKDYLEKQKFETVEQRRKHKKKSDEYYIEGWNNASDTLRLIYAISMGCGFAVWLLAITVLYFNERKHMSLHRVRQRIADYLVEAKDGRTDDVNEKKLIFAKGDLEFEKPARDHLLGFESTDGMLLIRDVAILQWQCAFDSANEKVFYKKIWSQKPIDSRRYPLKYQNPKVKMPFTSKRFYGTVKLGDLTLSHEQVNDLLET